MGSPYHRREVGNYVRYVVRRGVLAGAAWQAIRGGVIPGGVAEPPGFPALSSLERAGACGVIDSSDRFHALGFLPIGNGGEDAQELPLIGKPPWEGWFDDPEDRLLAHRFGWVLPFLAAGASPGTVGRLLDLAGRWIEAFPSGDGAEGWDSYSVAERTVHWIFLLSAARVRGIDRASTLAAMVEESLRAHPGFLLHHLELRGASTNNHLINDARALYLAGLYLGEGRFGDVGREILRYGAREMFAPSGFLREGSTHYHVLLCRSFLEVLWAARASGDHELFEGLRGRVEGMTRCTGFLWAGVDLPLIGDVSPDFPPAFHAGVPALGAELLGLESIEGPASPGWHSLFPEGRARERMADEEDCPSPKAGPIQAFSDAGYYRLAWKKWRLFLYANPLGLVPPWSHGHADLLGFLLYWEGTPLLVDPGRATYIDGPIGRYGRSARAHNGLMVDGLEPSVVHAHNGYTPTLLPGYYDHPASVLPEEKEDGVRVVVRCPGFGRLAPGLSVTRVLGLSGAGLRVEDEITGSGCHLVERFFHFHPAVEVSRDGGGVLRCAVPGGGAFRLREEEADSGAVDTRKEGSFSLHRGEAGHSPMGWFSPRYGELQSSWTVAWRGRLSLPDRRRFVLEKIG